VAGTVVGKMCRLEKGKSQGKRKRAELSNSRGGVGKKGGNDSKHRKKKYFCKGRPHCLKGSGSKRIKVVGGVEKPERKTSSPPE